MTTRFANGTVAEALTARAAEVAMALLGEPNRSLSSRRELRFRRKGSLAVVVDGAKCGRWYDHEDGLGGDLINLIERVRGVTFREAVAYAEQFVGSVPTLVTTPAPAASARSAEGDSRRNQRRAGNLWREAGPIVGTHAACYLEWRHVLEPALEAGNGVLRFHPNCPFGEDTRHPCLLALMRDIRGDQPSRRLHEVVQFEHDGFTYVAGIGRFDDGKLPKVFLNADKVGTAMETQARDAAVTASLFFQNGGSPEILRRALTRNADGNASSALGKLLYILLSEGMP